MAAAREQGDLIGDLLIDDFRFWFCHHLLVAVMMYRLPNEPVVPYKVSNDELAKQLMGFMLRGIGLTDNAIKRYNNFDSILTTIDHWIAMTMKREAL